MADDSQAPVQPPQAADAPKPLMIEPVVYDRVKFSREDAGRRILGVAPKKRG